MMIMLQPEQVAIFWDALKHGIIVAQKPKPENEQQLCNNILERLLNGKAQCWLSVTGDVEDRKFNAFGITTIEETALGEKYLYLHSMYAYRVVPNADLLEVMGMLKSFAQSIGALKIITFTRIDRLRTLFTEAGFTQDLSLYVKEL